MLTEPGAGALARDGPRTARRRAAPPNPSEEPAAAPAARPDPRLSSASTAGLTGRPRATMPEMLKRLPCTARLQSSADPKAAVLTGICLTARAV